MIFQLVPQAYAASWNSGCLYTDPNIGRVVTIKGIECVFQNIISPIPALLALVAVGMIIMAGIRLLTAGPDPKAYAAAWNTFTWAIVGLILLSAAWLIIVLIQKFTGANLSTFTLPTPGSTP
jgi:hypothetical protein